MPGLPPLPADRSVRFGFALCIVGFLIALGTFIPQVVGPHDFPWPVLAGSLVYMPGAFLAFASARGPGRNQVIMWVRVIRFGFFAILMIGMLRIAQG